MWIRAIRVKRPGILWGAALLILAGGALFLLRGRAQTVSGDAGVSARTDQERVAFLASCGWEAEPEPVEVQDVLIPETFNEVYERYQELQRKQGYDLTAYCGKTVRRYSYAVINHLDQSAPVRANLLVAGGKLIGGDICSAALDGWMTGFHNEE